MYEAVFRIEGDGAYEQSTDGTDTSIDLWCNDHCDLLQIDGGNQEQVLDQVRSTVGVRDRLEKDGTQLLITEECLKDNLQDNVESFLERHGVLLIPPLRYSDGEKWARVLALDSDSLSTVYKELNGEFDVEVETKREIQSVSPDSPFGALDAMIPDLSPRQRSVFLTAYEEGYFELPRGTTTEEIASKEGVERRTAEDHLRRAEKKLLDAIVDYI
jgi:predicted DNA binding protein